MTIVNLAQDYVGANNVNLLLPNGQYGTREGDHVLLHMTEVVPRVLVLARTETLHDGSSVYAHILKLRHETHLVVLARPTMRISRSLDPLLILRNSKKVAPLLTLRNAHNRRNELDEETRNLE